MSKIQFRSKPSGLSKIEEGDSCWFQRKKIGEYAHYSIR